MKATALPQEPVAGPMQESFTSQGIVEDTRRGLSDEPKWLSSLYFYDRVGSELFERITQTPEYYPTRTEEDILSQNADDIIAAAGPDLLLAEMGSGSSRKTRVIIAALMRRQRAATYLPIDISKEFLEEIAARLEAAFDGLRVEPICAEYKLGLTHVGQHEAHRRLVLFLGSSIGNFEPEEQVALLRAAHDALSPGDAFLLGTDLVKDPSVLEAAYNDSQGVTAAFNRNILRHVSRMLQGNVDPDTFEHRAFWNPERSRIEMHLVSTRAQRLRLPAADLEVDLQAGEAIHTENSYKFTTEQARSMAAAAGFAVERTWTDARGWFGVHLLRRE